jgi:hypothetical protein
MEVSLLMTIRHDDETTIYAHVLMEIPGKNLLSSMHLALHLSMRIGMK